jgi:hypothetical protein
MINLTVSIDEQAPSDAGDLLQALQFPIKTSRRLRHVP